MTSVNPSICFFIINLDGANERLEYVISQVKRYNLPFKRISAINGKRTYTLLIKIIMKESLIFLEKRLIQMLLLVFRVI